MSDEKNKLAELTANIVSNYVSNNSVAASDLPELINSTHKALLGVTVPSVATKQKPAVPIKKSIGKDKITCLECGRELTMLKRHVVTHGMTLEEYFIKWQLPSDYPTTSKNYSSKRSQMAKHIGLGKQGRGRK